MAPNTVAYAGRPCHWECTGAALETTKKHADPADITFLAMPFSSFSQRVWTALEYLEIPYQVRAINLFEPPKDLFILSPKGLVPALQLGNTSPPRGLNESLVILEYINELSATKGNKKSLLPPPEYTWSRALIRLQADLISRTILPCFYRYVQCQEPSNQVQLLKEFLDGMEKLLQLFDRAEKEREENAPKFGLWQGGGSLSLADVLIVPWLHRGNVVLKHYRDFSWSILYPAYPRFETYLDRLLSLPAFQATCSTNEVLLDSYEMYAFNCCPSQIAKAINKGRELP
ncbi:glutathione S-transferase [Clavulina sp. PMI_390]|nr:glutathione S-transferase [Clavulina sp. PMI_390]